ncbi:MAG TPA: ROK family protein [Jatrophihabitans sp.]
MLGASKPERIRRDRPITADSPSALAVFTEVLSRGSATRGELGTLTGLSAGAVTKAVRPLLAAGLLRERASLHAPVGAGRPVQIVEVVAERERFVGVKVNAEQIVAVATDLRATVTDTVEIALPRQGRSLAPHPPVEEVVTAIRRALVALGRHDVAAVGIAVSGDVDRSGGSVEFSPLLGWESVPLRDIVSAATRLPVVIDNDVRAVTSAEQWFGAGLGVDDFAVVTIGAGIGCGLVVSSKIQRGSFGVAGELGHVCVDVDGPRCHCGAQGCVEAIAGREELLTRAGEVAGRRVRTMAGLARLAKSDDGAAVRELLDHTGRCVAVAIASVVNLFGPRRVLISAEGFDADALFGPGLRQTLQRQSFGRAGEIEVLTRELPFSEWARGAAVIAITDFVGHRV